MSRVPQVEGMLSYLLKQEMELTQARDRAAESARSWVKRARAAYTHGEPELGAEAKARALEVKSEHDQLQLQLDSVKLKLADVRRQSKMRDETEAILRAEMLVEAFRLRGILPEESAPDPLLGPLEDEPPDEP